MNNDLESSIYNVLKGRFLTDDTSLKNWKLIVFIVFLLLMMITSAHRADKKVMHIAELNKKKRELNANYVDTGTMLTRMKLESSIREKLIDKGLAPSKTPPHKIRITHKKIKNNGSKKKHIK